MPNNILSRALIRKKSSHYEDEDDKINGLYKEYDENGDLTLILKYEGGKIVEDNTIEAEDIDIFDLSRKINSKKVVLIEWPERLQHERSFDLKIIFSHLPEGREVSLISGDNGFKEWLKTYE